MVEYIMKHGSNKLRAVICKMVAKGFDIEDYRTMVRVGLVSENVDSEVMYEYKRLYDDYYMEVNDDKTF